MNLGRIRLSGLSVLLILFALVKPGMVSAASADSFQDLLKAGNNARTTGDYQLAADKYSTALTLQPDNTDVLYLLGTSLAFSNQFEKAHQVLTRALELNPRNLGVRLARIRSAAWAGNRAAAENDMKVALGQAPDNVETLNLSGWLHYIQKRPGQAIKAYETALKLAPDSKQAVKGLDNARRALAGIALAQKKKAGIALARKKKEPASVEKKRWRLDTNYSHSSFSRVSRQRWQEPSVALAYILSEQWIINGRIDYSRRFGLTDVRAEGGATYRFTGGHNIYLNAGVTPDDDFLAQKRILAGGLINTGLELAGPLHLTLDTKREFYPDGVSDTFNPGLTQYFGPVYGTVRWVNSWSPSNRRTSGWVLQGNWQVADRLLVYFGKADAPETVEQTIVGQRSMFVGLVTGLTPDVDIRFDFARDDRKNSYIRRVLGFGLTVRY